MRKAYLILADGTVCEGQAVGEIRESTGELVFTTGMNGYIETLTDPSYYGQIVMQTFPLIGNYGIIPGDFEGGCFVRGYVTRELCDAPSNFRCETTVDEFLKSRGIPGICGIDTRALTRKIREHGVMNARIAYEPDAGVAGLAEYEVVDAVKSVSRRSREIHPAVGEKKYAVTLIDYGAKNNIIRELCRRGCEVTVVPYDTPAGDILAAKPDGLMLSNGPGDPAENVFCIGQIRELLGRLPIFGICLGHQLTALAAGARTYKLKYGHRGVNQPVRDLTTGRTYITTQNHGYAVDGESVPAPGRELFVNANDGTCEGMDYGELNCFTVQFHPEACSGPKDTGFLFDRFISRIKEGV